MAYLDSKSYDYVRQLYPPVKIDPEDPPNFHSAILEITQFLMRFLCKKIPRYRVEMLAQRFANRLIDRLRNVSTNVNGEEGDQEEKYIVPTIQKPRRKEAYHDHASELSFAQSPYPRKSKVWRPLSPDSEKSGDEKESELDGICFEIAVSVYNDLKDQFFADEIIVEACNDCFLNVAEVLRKFPANMVIRCVEGTVYAMFDTCGDSFLGFEVNPKDDLEGFKDVKDKDDVSDNLLTLCDDDDVFTDPKRDSKDSKDDDEKLSESPTETEDFGDMKSVKMEEVNEDELTFNRSVMSSPNKVDPDSSYLEELESDVYAMDLQVRQVPRFDYLKEDTAWVDEFYIIQRDPKFTAQTFAGTRFGSVKLKSHQYSDRGAGFYHFTMPSVLPILRFLSTGATISTSIREFFEVPIPDGEEEKDSEEDSDDDDDDEEEEKEIQDKQCKEEEEENAEINGCEEQGEEAGTSDQNEFILPHKREKKKNVVN